MIRRRSYDACLTSFVAFSILFCLSSALSAQTPHIDSITPTNGVPGTQVTFTGTGFGATQGNGIVWLSGTYGTVLSWNDTQIVATVTTSAVPGQTKIQKNGAWSNLVTFTLNPPTLTSISPMSGRLGTQVTFTGSGFGATRGSGQVWLASNMAGSIVSWNDTEVVATVAEGVQAGQAKVQQYGVWSNQIGFSITAPSITSISPTSAPPGAPITINGIGFGNAQGSGQVTLGTLSAAGIVSWNDTQVVATVATGSASGNVRVKQYNVFSNGVAFPVLPAPTITSLSPTSGPAGTSVTISGTNFGATQSTNTVKFNGTTASPTSWGASSITVPVPAGATSGNAVVTVAGGPSNGVSFTVPPPPSLSQLTPTSGPLGTPISLTGSNFGSTQGSSQVRVSGVAATVTSWGGNSITATIPNGVTTRQALPVTVVTSAGTSNALGFTASTPPNVTGVVINPHMASMVVGETRTLQATGPSGVVVPGLLWLSSDNNVVSLSYDDPPVITALATGQATISAGDGSATITVYAGPTLAEGTVKWSVPGDGSGVSEIIPAVPSSEGVADVFAFQESGAVQAITADGTVAWSADTIGAVQKLPDFQGGLVLSAQQSIKKLDGITGQAYPSYTASTNYISLASTLVHTDGTIFTVDNNTIVGIDPKTGQAKFIVQPAEHSSTDGGSGNCGEYVPVPRTSPANVSAGIIAGDGFAYFPYEYSISTASKSCSPDGSESSQSHLQNHVRVLRVGSNGSAQEIVVGDGSIDNSITCGPSDQAPPGPPVAECPNLTSSTHSNVWSGAGVGGTFITNADQGVVYSSHACSNPENQNTCGPRLTTITSDATATTVALTEATDIQPTLQAEDGSYFGTMTVNNVAYLSVFEASGNVRWQIQGDFQPLIALADGRMIALQNTSNGMLRVTFDVDGNPVAQVADDGRVQSGTGHLYIKYGPVAQFSGPADLVAPSWWAFTQLNNGTAAIRYEPPQSGLQKISSANLTAQSACNTFLDNLTAIAITNGRDPLGPNFTKAALLDEIKTTASRAMDYVHDGESSNTLWEQCTEPNCVAKFPVWFTGEQKPSGYLVKQEFEDNGPGTFHYLEGLSQYNGFSVWLRLDQWSGAFKGAFSSYITTLSMSKAGQVNSYGLGTLFHETLHKKSIGGGFTHENMAQALGINTCSSGAEHNDCSTEIGTRCFPQ